MGSCCRLAAGTYVDAAPGAAAADFTRPFPIKSTRARNTGQIQISNGVDNDGGGGGWIQMRARNSLFRGW